MDVWMGFEVKTSEGATFAMSNAQRVGGDGFVRDRIDTIADGKGAYQHEVDSNLRAFAQRVQREMRDKSYATYVVLNGHINTPNPQTEIQVWDARTGNPRFSGRR